MCTDDNAFTQTRTGPFTLLCSLHNSDVFMTRTDIRDRRVSVLLRAAVLESCCWSTVAVVIMNTSQHWNILSVTFDFNLIVFAESPEWVQ